MKIEKTNDLQDEQLFDGPANHLGRLGTHEEFGPWFHNLHLPGGEQTAPAHPLGDYPASAWAQIRPRLPEDLQGWSVLNLGCNAGYFCLELARLGARVLGYDRDPHCVRQAQWAAELFGMGEQIKFRQMHVYEVARAPEHYDLVLFMGAFHELRYPNLALDIMAERADKMLIFQPFSSIAPFKIDEFSALQTARLESLGFEVERAEESEIYHCRRPNSPWQQRQSPGATELAAAVGPRYRRIERRDTPAPGSMKN